MKISKRGYHVRSQKGAFAALGIIALAPLLVAIGCFAVDSQHIQTSRAELQRACDAGALAGANGLYKYGTDSASAAEAYIKNRAEIVTGLNETDGRSVANDTDPNTLTSIAVDVDPPTPTFGGTVRVSATMRIHSIFAQILGPQFNAQNVRAQGTAGPSGNANQALSRSLWPSVISVDAPDPDGNRLENLAIGQTIKFEYQNPDGSSAAWTALETGTGGDGNTNANEVKQRMDQYRNPQAGGTGHPPVTVGSNISVSNGSMSSCFNDAAAFVNKQVVVPVTEGTLGPSQTSARVIGFIAVTIISIGSGNDKSITMRLDKRGSFLGAQDGTGDPWEGHDTFFTNQAVRPVKLLL